MGSGRNWTHTEDRVVQVVTGPLAEGKVPLYMISRKDAPKGKLLQLDLDCSPEQWRERIEGEGA